MNTFDDRTEPSTSGLHPLSVGHLVMGIAFAGLLGLWALYVTDNVNMDQLGWLAPVPWLAAGAIGIVAVVLGPWRRNRAEERARLQAYREQRAEEETRRLEDDLLGGGE
jgi:hypothetical protein